MDGPASPAADCSSKPLRGSRCARRGAPFAAWSRLHFLQRKEPIMHATHTTALRERMRQELQLAGLSERTQEAYLRAVRQLATHFGRPPDQITDPELRRT